jgi:hypothetical protein
MNAEQGLANALSLSAQTHEIRRGVSVRRTDKCIPVVRLPPLTIESVKEVQTTLTRLIDEVYSSKLSPKTAAGLAALLNLQWRVIRSTDLEKRISRLEQARAQSQDSCSSTPATVQSSTHSPAHRHDGFDDENVPENDSFDSSS